jgi:hypothetical protein
VAGYSFEAGGLLEPREEFEDGALFGVAGGEPLLTVAWAEEGPGTTLDEVVREDLMRILSEPGTLLVDREPGAIGGVECVRTFTLHLAGDGEATASEQWRLLAGGRRWTVSAMSTLADQPHWGPRLAAVAATFRAG